MRLALTIIIVLMLLAILASIMSIAKRISGHKQRRQLTKVACPQCGAGFSLPSPDKKTQSQESADFELHGNKVTCSYCGTKFERE